MLLETICITETSIVHDIQSKVSKATKPVEETIPKRLDDIEAMLHSSLLSTQKHQDNVEEASRWLKKMEIAVASQSLLSAESEVSERQLEEQKLVVDEVER